MKERLNESMLVSSLTEQRPCIGMWVFEKEIVVVLWNACSSFFKFTYIVSSNHRIHDETIMPSENKLDLFCDSPVERHWVSGRCFLLMIVSVIVSTTAALLFGGMIVPVIVSTTAALLFGGMIVPVIVSTTAALLFGGMIVPMGMVIVRLVIVSVVVSTAFLFLGVLVSMVVSTTFLSMIVSVGMVVVFVFLPVIMAVLVSTAASVIVLVFVFLGLSVILVVVAVIFGTLVFSVVVSILIVVLQNTNVVCQVLDRCPKGSDVSSKENLVRGRQLAEARFYFIGNWIDHDIMM